MTANYVSNPIELYGISFIVVNRNESISIEPKYNYDYQLTRFQQNVLLSIQNKIFSQFSYQFINMDILTKIHDEFNRLVQEVKIEDKHFPGDYQAEMHNLLMERNIYNHRN
jgi:hypothetical protein